MKHDISTYEGTQAEKLFLKTANEYNCKLIRKANPNEDKFEHWDFLLSKNEKQFTIDIKAHKHEYRNGPLLKYWFWFEFKNVKGNKGWLFGQADYIAFEYFGKFLLYNRKELAKIVVSLVDTKCLVKKPKEAKYKLYQRHGREDQVSLIKISDLPEPKAKWIIS